MPIAVSGSNIVFADGSSIASGFTGFKNRIINGAMVIDQRNAGSAVTANDAHPVDRMRVQMSTDGAYSAQQDSSAPAGFNKSVKITTTTADASLGSTQYLQFQQRIEGTNTADLNWGTANAKTVTLSFWVRSSLTGTFGGVLGNSAFNYSYPFTYTISAVDTWEYKTITVTGPTSGTWVTDSSDYGIVVRWGLGVGSSYSGTAGAWTGSGLMSVTGATSVIGTLNATWYITGVQLEAGSSATSFEYRDYGNELRMCQRYYQYMSNVSGKMSTPDGSATYVAMPVYYKVTMRATPTITWYAPSLGTAGYVEQWGGTQRAVSSTNADSNLITYVILTSGITTQSTISGHVKLEAEL